MHKQSARVISFFGALTGWFAIITQFVLLLQNRTVPTPLTLLRFFGYFTVNTNILVALCFTSIFLGYKSKLGKFFRKVSTITAIAVYITVVGVVYNIILRSLWEPKGMQMIVDELLHTIIPSTFFFFWMIFTPGEQLKWEMPFSWLIYPIVYIIYCLVHGSITGFYPYPFVDVTKLGYEKAIMNSGLVLLIIFLLSLLLIAVGKLIKRPLPR